MTLVDSSVWIAHFRRHQTQATATRATLADSSSILVGDIILLEVLRGARDETHSARIEREMRRFDVLPLLDDGLAVLAARNFRRLRALGITIRKTAALIIGTFCIAHGHRLLHNDRDFDPMAAHLGLLVA
jgi:predicted nucleic acid-binding protein